MTSAWEAADIEFIDDNGAQEQNCNSVSRSEIAVAPDFWRDRPGGTHLGHQSDVPGTVNALGAGNFCMHRACAAAYAMARTGKQALKGKRSVSIKVSEQFSPDTFAPHGDISASSSVGSSTSLDVKMAGSCNQLEAASSLDTVAGTTR
jgi:hypothetical protein